MRIVPFHQRFTVARPPQNAVRLMTRQCPRRRGFRSRGLEGFLLGWSESLTPKFIFDPEFLRLELEFFGNRLW
ncbi:hypothetical protein Y032_0001g167 [Ancylostoma ceylanicum]|uniref:Uncharacterized protein n=1 Tax=Ancylostoma ceylanicum TaxID=53326 RepID=A0A016W239_9BILA|nr:hypothetical protein Y032_0001g167 [Ancylostoma ceylanicum]